MPDDTFVTHVLDLLEPALGPLAVRAMMGGHLVFCDGVSVALLSDERLYLKADEATKAAFAGAGGEPFVYVHAGRRVAMSYWTPPDGALDDPEERRPWARLALEAALRSKKPAARARAGTRPAAREEGAAPSRAVRRKSGGRTRRRPRRAARPGAQTGGPTACLPGAALPSVRLAGQNRRSRVRRDD